MPLSFHCGVEQRSARRAHNPEVIGSNPIPATTKKVGVAQLVEHGTHKPGVVGSIPTPDTKFTHDCLSVSFVYY